MVKIKEHNLAIINMFSLPKVSSRSMIPLCVLDVYDDDDDGNDPDRNIQPDSAVVIKRGIWDGLDRPMSLPRAFLRIVRYSR